MGKIEKLVVGGFVTAGLVMGGYSISYNPQSPYLDLSSNTSYAKDHYFKKTREKLEQIKKRIQERDKSGKSREDAKKIAGAVLENVYGIPGASKGIEWIDKNRSPVKPEKKKVSPKKKN